MASQSQYRDLNYSFCKFKSRTLIALLLRDLYSSYIVDAIISLSISTIFLFTTTINTRANEFENQEFELTLS